MLSKKSMYDKLVTKVNAIDDKISRTTGLVKQTSQVSKKKKKTGCLQKDTQH